jgi:hypothetical protein
MMDLYKRVPKDLHENLLFRRWLYRRAAGDVALQAALREYCKRDILFWINVFCWTYDPRLKGNKTIPFLTYQFQDEAILELQDAIRAGEQATMPKSRDMGASWIVLMVFDHHATFEDDSKFFALSRNAALVDKKGDSDCLFWKIDHVHKYLPSWLRPRIELANTGQRTSMRFTYLDTNSSIIGGTTTRSAGVGGRATAVLVDEFSRYDPTIARLVKSGLKDVSNAIIWPFTRSPEMGRQHPSYELVEQAKKGNLRYIPLHWTQHPVKALGHYRVDPKTRLVEVVDKTFEFPPNFKFQMDGRFEHHSPWFDKYRRGSNDRDVADNLEFDDEVGGNSIFDSVMIKEYSVQYCRPADIEGDLEYDAVTGDPIEFVVRRGGPIKLWAPLDVLGRLLDVPYVAGCDLSLGMGRTNSCMSVARSDIGEKVLEFVTPHMKPDHFAIKCVAICRWLNQGEHRTLLGWERGGPGETFGLEVQKIRYFPIYAHQSKSAVRATFNAPTPGVSPNLKGPMFAAYQTALSRGTFVNHSQEAMDETLEWQHTPLGPKHNADKNRANDPSGASLNHGDRVVADVICEMLVRERGTPVARVEKEIIQPGSLAWMMREDERQERSSRTLYPNWNKKLV